MNTNPFEQTNIALKSAAALVDQSRDEIARLAKERDQLKQQLAQAQAACGWMVELKSQGWLSPDEAKRLEADAACLRKALQFTHESWSDCFHDATSSCCICKALSTTAGRSLLQTLELITKERDELIELRTRWSGNLMAMRKALQRVWDEDECGWIISEGEEKECVKCGSIIPKQPHTEDCTQGFIEDALKEDAGRSLLERLERYEKALEFIGGYPGWDIVVIQQLAREALKGDK